MQPGPGAYGIVGFNYSLLQKAKEFWEYKRNENENFVAQGLYLRFYNFIFSR